MLFAMLLFPLFWYLATEKGVASAVLLAKKVRKKLEVFILRMKFGEESTVGLRILIQIYCVGSSVDLREPVTFYIAEPSPSN